MCEELPILECLCGGCCDGVCGALGRAIGYACDVICCCPCDDPKQDKKDIRDARQSKQQLSDFTLSAREIAQLPQSDQDYIRKGIWIGDLNLNEHTLNGKAVTILPTGIKVVHGALIGNAEITSLGTGLKEVYGKVDLLASGNIRDFGVLKSVGQRGDVHPDVPRNLYNDIPLFQRRCCIGRAAGHIGLW